MRVWVKRTGISFAVSPADRLRLGAVIGDRSAPQTHVWRWREWYMAEGVVALTLVDPPGETTHWTADMMAEASGISASAVRRIWKAHGCSRIVTGCPSCPAIQSSSTSCAM